MELEGFGAILRLDNRQFGFASRIVERFVLFEEVHEALGGRGTVRKLWREARIAEGWPEEKVGGVLVRFEGVGLQR